MNLETTTAVYAGNVRLSYGMIIAVFAFLSSWMLTVSLTCPGQEGTSQSVKSFMALRVKQLVSLLMYGVFAAALGSFFGRLIYWYSHYESYDGITGAFSSSTKPGWCWDLLLQQCSHPSIWAGNS